jgi:hypothetical protein
MNRTVIQLVAATALSLLSVGCATTTTSTRIARHSDSEVEMALQDAERSALERMAASIDPETAQAARQLSLAEGR